MGVKIIAADLGNHQFICGPPESTVCPQSGYLPGRQAVLRDRADAFDRLVDRHIRNSVLSILKQSEQRDHCIDYNFRSIRESLDVTCRVRC